MSLFKALSLKVRSAFYAFSIHVTAEGIELKGQDLGALMHRFFNAPLNIGLSEHLPKFFFAGKGWNGGWGEICEIFLLLL